MLSQWLSAGLRGTPPPRWLAGWLPERRPEENPNAPGTASGSDGEEVPPEAPADWVRPGMSLAWYDMGFQAATRRPVPRPPLLVERR